MLLGNVLLANKADPEMGKLRKPCRMIAAAFLATCVVVGSAKAVTVTVETSGGAGTSATYYTQGGDWATGDATVSANGSVSLTTNGSVEMGLVRADSGAGVRAFTPYTGDFSANANAAIGGAASSSATSANPRVDIFVVSPSGPNSTVDGYAGAMYNAFHGLGGAVTAAEGAGDPDGKRPDWILVDQGTYTEEVTINDFEDNSALTSAWGAGDTIINRTRLIGRGVDVANSESFRIEGFTVQGGIGYAGIDVDSSPNAQIVGNTVTDRVGDGIQVTRSGNAQITNNTTTNNVRNGIYVTFSDGTQITNNTITNNEWNGINVKSSAEVKISGNTITGNGSAGDKYGGVYLQGDVSLATINANNIAGNHNYGLWNNTDGFPVDATNNWWGQAPARYRGNLTVGAPGPTGTDIWDAGVNTVNYQPVATTPFPLP